MSQGNPGRGRGNWRGRGGQWRGRGNWNQRGRGHYGRGGRGNFNSGASNSSQRPRVIQSTLLDIPTPYKGWKLYFPEQAYSDQSPIVTRTQVFEKYFISWKDLYKTDDIELKGYFSLDFKELVEDSGITQSLPELAKELKQMPETILNCLGLALHQILTKELESNHSPDDAVLPAPQFNIPKIHCRLKNYTPLTQLRLIKANYYGKFVAVKGTVVRVSNIKPMCSRLAFECVTCAAEQVLLLPDGKYIQPTQCPSAECRGRTFNPLRSHSRTETIDWQTIRVQEIFSDDQRESGRIPRTVDCELTHDLVDSCVPGDVVNITGTVKVQASDEGRGKQRDKCMFLLYIHANSVTNSKGSKSSASSDSGCNTSMQGVSVEFTVKELYAIEEIQEEPHLFKLLVGSICPSIYGHEMVKAGLVLGLFGGAQKFVNDKNRIPVRGDPHILVVGDPGLGKSQMLQAAASVAPRSVYVCGNTSTTSGLTVTLSREAGGGSGDYALEAGALVLADQGCCCIDEFDKMGNQHQALLEAMEQQSISIAKAGIVCSLPARTSIIAAANPVGGHYDKAKTVSENLRMGSALLSRFDLVFILMDKPDADLDAMLSDHVMALHAGRRGNSRGNATAAPGSMSAEEEAARRIWMSQQPLSHRIKVAAGETLDVLPPQLLRKYIAYARKYVHPKITAEAAKVLQAFYLDLRSRHQTTDSTPITTRQLESLMRLSEARARLELREDVSEDDARDVIDIMKYSMFDTYMNEFGVLDFNRSQHGSGMSSKSQAKKFISLLHKVSQKNQRALFSVQDMRQLAKDYNIIVKDFESFIGSLNNQGYLLKKGPRLYQLQISDF